MSDFVFALLFFLLGGFFMLWALARIAQRKRAELESPAERERLKKEAEWASYEATPEQLHEWLTTGRLPK